MSTTLMEVCQKLAVAVEISSKTWVVASYVGGTSTIRRKSLSQETAAARFEALVAEIEVASERAGVTDMAQVLTAYEAGQEGFWLVRALRARGFNAQVIDPVSLLVDRRAKRAKTDRLDAQALARGVWGYMNGDSRALRMIRIPDTVDEDAREWQRERDRLERERRACADRIRKKLRSHGIWQVSRTWRKQLREASLRTFAGHPLDAMLQATLVVELDRLEAAEGHLKQWNKQVQHLAPAVAQRITRLSHLRGIGVVGARGLALQLFWRHFDNRRQVGGCVGLVGVPYDSGTQRCDQGISKAGDPHLRALLVELAWMWLRYQPDSALAKWFAERTSGAGKRGKRIMIVAVARKLAIALWKYLQHGIVPDGARMKVGAAMS